VATLDVAANYGRKVGNNWEDDTHWNRVTCFGKNIDRADKMAKGDLVHITGRVRQSRYDCRIGFSGARALAGRPNYGCQETGRLSGDRIASERPFSPCSMGSFGKRQSGTDFGKAAPLCP